MSTQPDYIIKDPQWRASEDYARLRAEGLRHIEQLGHALWTDYNVHDPGITQLELLCYAITDLGYRTNYAIKDLLTKEGKNIADSGNEFHTANAIFSCSPVSFNDLRKLLIDIEGVRYAWIEKHNHIAYAVDYQQEKLTTATATSKNTPLNGLYDVYIDYEEAIETDSEKTNIIKQVKQRLFSQRNLCEDIVAIHDLEKEDIAVCADIEVTVGADIEAVLAEVFYQLEQFIAPDVAFYSIEELLQKGKTSDEIFAGPALNHGFIDDDEFRQIERHCSLRVSDIMRIIMDVADVTSIKNISLLRFIDAIKKDQQPWILPLASDTFRSLRFSEALSRITFYKNGLPYFANPIVVTTLLKEKRAATLNHRLKGHDTDLPLPVGDDKAVADYYPIQNEMPATYYVGQQKVPESASPERKAQAKQLKTWMLFFEQILANYLAQLSNIDQLFSWQENASSNGYQTYFSQQVTGIADIEALFVDYDQLPTALDAIIESKPAAEKRKNKLLNHLLARFCESFTDYSLLMYNLEGDFTQQRLIADKRAFLNDYPRMSQQRGQGFDYRCPALKTNISGYQRRIYRLLGIDELKRQNLSWHGFHIKEITPNPEKPAIKHYRFVLQNAEKKKLFISVPCDTRDSVEALLDLALSKGCCSSNYHLTKNKKRYQLIHHCDDNKPAQKLGHTVNKQLLETLGYFQDYANREGFHVIEHILLRPRNSTDTDLFMPIQLNHASPSYAANNCHCIEVKDPYSFRFSVILPAWPQRFQDLRFRQFVEDTLRMEAPAHTQAKICWLSHTQMQTFETDYNDWAKKLAAFDTTLDKQSATPAGYNQSLKKLINTLHTLTTLYPLARLHDCKHIDTDAPPITLNNTILGTF